MAFWNVLQRDADIDQSVPAPGANRHWRRSRAIRWCRSVRSTALPTKSTGASRLPLASCTGMIASKSAARSSAPGFAAGRLCGRKNDTFTGCICVIVTSGVAAVRGDQIARLDQDRPGLAVDRRADSRVAEIERVPYPRRPAAWTIGRAWRRRRLAVRDRLLREQRRSAYVVRRSRLAWSRCQRGHRAVRAPPDKGRGSIWNSRSPLWTIWPS